VLESTFQLGPGLGPRRERALWQSGIAHWSEVPDSPATRRLRAQIDVAASLMTDADALARLIPSREHWRLFARFAEDAAYLDIETSDDVVGFCGISAIGVHDRNGAHLLLAGRDLEDFPALAAEWKVLVTFNGLSFDVPILRSAFPDWQPPVCHIDLRHLFPRLGLTGGLKSLERRLPLLHLRRPSHLDGLDGWGASSLFRRGRDGDRQAMRTFAEYNLYDAINLRTLMAFAYNRMIERELTECPSLHASAVQIPERGDVLYDVSKILLAI
jgi:uncharacterized protein YprB with RNaseH-like and TPR domain